MIDNNIFLFCYLDMERSWMCSDRRSVEFDNGVEEFIKFSIEHIKNFCGVLRCPCLKCGNCKEYNINIVKEHLYFNGIDVSYKKWIWHGESLEDDITEHIETDVEQDTTMNQSESVRNEAFEETLQFETSTENIYEGIHMKEDSDIPLYEGCSEFTKTSAVVRLYNLKAINGWSDKSFSELLKLISEMLPKNNVLPQSVYEAKKTLSDMGLQYQKIHACRNNCILYRNEYKDFNECPICGCSRWKKRSDSGKIKKSVPVKVLWYMPIVPRFQRLFRNKEHAKNLVWHSDRFSLVSDNYLRHPADTPQWKTLDYEFPEFADDPRNLRLGLCTDGINPFGIKGTQYSCWPVMLCIYNLPSWLCMKRKFIMLTMIISGPKQPGNKVDTYLQPLIEDLKYLWNEGVMTYDAYRNENFKLKAAILWTINDFPAYGILSGRTVKGYKACPICDDHTNSIRLRNGKKICYMSHRKWLPRNHPYRKKKKPFNGEVEECFAPRPIDGKRIHELVSSLQQSDSEKNSWKRRSIFFDLPYWDTLLIRHNLDVMHIEKNICESIIGTLLNISGKTKDSHAARLDIQEMGIKETLAPVVKDGRTFIPAGCFTLTVKERKRFCQILSSIKVPDGYSSNIRSKIQESESKLINLKSHDCHVLIQQILPVAIRDLLPEEFRSALTRFCFFFNKLCSKVVDTTALDKLQLEIVETLCMFEMYYPPAFFDIMVHLSVHLIKEVKLCGPVYLRWMYPFERYMKVLKSYVRNRYRPEACIVECYISEESLEYFSNLLPDEEVLGISKHKDNISEGRGIIGPSLENVYDRTILAQAHLYVLSNTAIVEKYIDLHFQYLKEKHPTRSKREVWLQQQHRRTFIDWFSNIILNEELDIMDNDRDALKWLARGPSHVVLKYKGYVINGHRYYIEQYDNERQVQNSGVSLLAKTMQVSSSKDINPITADMCYYGIIEEIWELDYVQFRIPVFKCKWVDNVSGVSTSGGFRIINFSHIGYKAEPFILASQATQVFYVTDPTNSSHSIVLSFTPRHIFNPDNEEDIDQIMSTFATELEKNRNDNNISDDEPDYVVSEEGVWVTDSDKRKRWFVLIFIIFILCDT